MSEQRFPKKHYLYEYCNYCGFGGFVGGSRPFTVRQTNF